MSRRLWRMVTGLLLVVASLILLLVNLNWSVSQQLVVWTDPLSLPEWSVLDHEKAQEPRGKANHTTTHPLTTNTSSNSHVASVKQETAPRHPSLLKALQKHGRSANPVVAKRSYLDITNDTSIRSWKCGLTQTPLIFVHLAKAGGGSIRRRIAYSAVQYTRSLHQWGQPHLDQSYYPIRRQSLQPSNGTVHPHLQHDKDKAYFCNSGHYQYMPIPQHRTYEGTRVCTATTPLGQAMACPEPERRSTTTTSTSTSTCYSNQDRVVYVGHNGFGTEVHWLSQSFLESWWNTEWVNQLNENNTKKDATYLSLQWQHRHQFGDAQHSHGNDAALRQRRQDTIDQRTNRFLSTFPAFSSLGTNTNNTSSVGHAPTSSVYRGRAYAALYASVPVLRVVLMREPFAWLGSKFAWHDLSQRGGVVCDDITYATAGAGHFNIYREWNQSQLVDYEQQQPERQPQTSNNNNNNNNHSSSQHAQTAPRIRRPRRRGWQRNPKPPGFSGSWAPGWMRRYALNQVYDLCGSDCRVRHFQNRSTLTEIVAQAEWNLRHSFAVVGILPDYHDETEPGEEPRTLQSSSNTTRSDTLTNPPRRPKPTKKGGSEQFLELLAQRIDYLDTIVQPPVLRRAHNSSVSSDDVGHSTAKIHSTVGREQACKQRFRDSSFQQAVLQASPEVAALVHLYKVAVQVNQFQQAELEACRAGNS